MSDTKGLVAMIVLLVLAFGGVAATVYFDAKSREQCLDMGGRVHTWTTEHWRCSVDPEGWTSCGTETDHHWKCVDLPAERPTRRPLP